MFKQIWRRISALVLSIVTALLVSSCGATADGTEAIDTSPGYIELYIGLALLVVSLTGMILAHRSVDKGEAYSLRDSKKSRFSRFLNKQDEFESIEEQLEYLKKVSDDDTRMATLNIEAEIRKSSEQASVLISKINATLDSTKKFCFISWNSVVSDINGVSKRLNVIESHLSALKREYNEVRHVENKMPGVIDSIKKLISDIRWLYAEIILYGADVWEINAKLDAAETRLQQMSMQPWTPFEYYELVALNEKLAAIKANTHGSLDAALNCEEYRYNLPKRIEEAQTSLTAAKRDLAHLHSHHKTDWHHELPTTGEAEQELADALTLQNNADKLYEADSLKAARIYRQAIEKAESACASAKKITRLRIIFQQLSEVAPRKLVRAQHDLKAATKLRGDLVASVAVYAASADIAIRRGQSLSNQASTEISKHVPDYLKIHNLARQISEQAQKAMEQLLELTAKNSDTPNEAKED